MAKFILFLAVYLSRNLIGPEGYLEAFANIYAAFALKIKAVDDGEDADARTEDCPGIEAAVRGMTFIELAVSASASDIKWHAFPRR